MPKMQITHIHYVLATGRTTVTTEEFEIHPWTRGKRIKMWFKGWFKRWQND